MFPYAQIYWPLQAAQRSLWYSRRIYGLNPQLIYYSFAIGTVLWAVTRAVHIPFSIIGLAMGVALPAPVAPFIGALIFRALQKRFGDPNRIRSYAYMFMGGIGVGFAAAIAISVSIVMISKSTWILPY